MIDPIFPHPVVGQFECNDVIPGRGRSPRARNPGTQTSETLGNLVFMDSGPGPSGRPGMTVLPVTFKLTHYPASRRHLSPDAAERRRALIALALRIGALTFRVMQPQKHRR